LQVGMQEQPFQCILCFFLALTDDCKHICTCRPGSTRERHTYLGWQCFTILSW
jgi:hypothetical protein